MTNDEERELLPFSGSQKELWLSSQTSLSEYNEIAIRVCFFVKNKVSPERVKEAIRVALQYTPLLSASLCRDEKEPCFKIGGCEEIDFRFFDACSETNSTQAARQYIEDFFEESVDEQLIRFALIHTAKSESIYAVKCSHLISDGLSMFFHVNFVADIYSSLLHGKELSLGEKCSCKDLYLKDKKYFESSKFGKDIDFWEKHLEQIPEKRIFRARSGFADVLGRSRHKKYYLSEDLSRVIEGIIAKYKISPTVYFTGLHALIISFMCDEKKVAIQTPIAFGERKPHKKRQGTHISLPPVFLDLSQYESFEKLTKEVAAQSMSFFRHIRTPYQMALRKLSHKRLEYLGDTFVNSLPNLPKGNPDFSFSTLEQFHSNHEAVLFGTLVLQDPGTNQFSLTVRNSRNHLSEKDVERYVKRIELLSCQLEFCSDISQLTFLLEEEEKELLGWQQGQRKNYAIKTIPEFFDDTVDVFKEKHAVKDEHGSALSYAEVQERSLSCASWLMEKGVKKGDIVGVLAKRSIKLAETILGIMRAGAIYLPLDPKSPAKRIDYIVNDAKAVLTIDLDKAGYKTTSGKNHFEKTSPQDGAYLIYTSGSTGKPKGVLVSHSGFVNMIQGQMEIFGLSQRDNVLQFASPAFDASLSEIFMSLLSGACLYPVTDRYRNEPWTLKEYMEENAISVTTFPPSYLHLFDRDDFSGLRVLITAGEAPVATDALHYASRLEYFNAYGPTEACVCASIKKVSPEEQLPFSSGRPIPNVTAYILNSEKKSLPAGMVGELWIGGASLALGYYENRQLTGERFQSLPWAKEERIYATGDLALWSEQGEIVLVGRTDDQVKIRGNRVELGEVSFLLERCEAVSQASVLATEDATGQAMLAAFIVLSPGTQLETIISWSKGNLPTYMIPSFWHQLSTMPVTVTGKIDRDALKNIVKKKPLSKLDTQKIDSKLLSLCELVLGKKYDPETDFFVQGGDSLKAMSLLHEIRNKYTVDIPFRDFVKCESLFEVAALLQKKQPESAKNQYDTIPLNQNQFQLWAYQQANDESIDYNMPFLMEVKGELAETFMESFYRAVKDQALFSCTVAGDIDNPCFEENDTLEIPMHVTEFSDSDSAKEYFEDQIHTPFDLRNEPLIRLEVARFSGRFQMLVLAHHIVGDAESIEILLRNALQYVHNKKGVKGLLATQVEFCQRENAYLRSSDFKADQAYWGKNLAPPLPFLHASSKRKGAMASVGLGSELVSRLKILAQKSGTTLLAGFVTLLGDFLRKTYGKQEILIGVPVGLRETQDEFNAAGFFVNTIALRLQARGELDIVSATRETATQLKEAITHNRYCNRTAVADILATHSCVENIEEEGLFVEILEPQLKASKFTGSFTLETGAKARIVLEYDELFIKNGSSLLEDFKQFIENECAGILQRSSVQIFADAWQVILHSEANEQSDFLRDGGDSIKAIQITGVLHRNHVKVLSAADFIRTPGFGDLCRLLDKAEDFHAGGEPSYASVEAGQKVPLLPLQEALIQNHPDHWKNFYMLLPMEISSGIEQDRIESWLQTLPGRFEALRLSFAKEGAPFLYAPEKITLKSCFIESGISRTELFRNMFKVVIAGLNLETGQTFGAGLAEQEGRQFLVFAGHHLVLDALSLDILRQDLIHFCRNTGELCETYGVATRAVEVEKMVEDGLFPTQEDYRFWESVCQTPTAKLDAVHEGRKDTASERIFKSEQLEGFRLEHTNSAQADLLSALSIALHEQGQREAVFMTLESHGRDALLPGFDPSHSVGWFTAVCPMPLKPVSSLDDAREEIQPWLREFFSPQNCNAYGYLARKDSQIFGYDSQISFNYFGKFIGETEPDLKPLLSLAMPGNIPELMHPDFEPDSPLELIVFFDDAGVLHLGAYFSQHVLNPEWVSGLLGSWIETLKKLPAYRAALPEDIQNRIREISYCEKEDIESIHPPDKSHEPMLYQYLSTDKSTYTQQIEFYFKGHVDDFLLIKAWTEVISRHESLRSLFPMPFAGEFYRVALRKARTSTEYFDLSHLPEPLALTQKNELLEAERKRGFDLNKGPLLRTQIYRFDSNGFMLSWCFHHLLMDGWCMGILLRELFVLYETLDGGSSERLPDPIPLSDYVRWRSSYDDLSARQYWDSLLDGFKPLTGIAKKEQTQAVVDPVTIDLTLDVELSKKLQMVASARSVTLPILIQSLWAILLSSENSFCRDVVYGIVTSGRPADLDGIDRTVGLFIQTIPLRVSWSEDNSFENLLRDVKEQSLDQMQHGYLPLAEIGRDLFDHLIVFENYPFGNLFRDGELELVDVNGFEKIPYPLGISVVPGDTIQFRFLYDPARMDHEYVLGLSEKFHGLLQAVPVDRDISCLELENQIIQRDPGAIVDQGCDVVSSFPLDRGAGDLGKREKSESVGETEEIILRVYESVLDCKVPSTETDFFELGGHSLSAMRVLAQVCKKFSVKLAIEDIMSNSSVKALAEFINSASASTIRIPHASPKESYPLSTSQRRIWFLQRLHEDSRIYLIPFAAQMQAPVDSEVLQKALCLLESRHDALRLRVSADEPEQKLVPIGSLRLEYYDYPYSQEGLEDDGMEFGFDNPLVRVSLFRESESDFVLLLRFHHIVFDGWSAEIFVRELNQAYEAILKKTLPDWQPLEIGYVSYVVWEAGQEFVGFDQIKKNLLPLPDNLKLPLDYPRPARQSLEGNAFVFELSREQSLGLKSYASDLGVTLFPVLIAFIKTLIYRHTGQNDLIVGCPAANRELEEVQDMIGLFVNTLVICTTLRKEKGFEALVKDVHASFQDALSTQAYPFEKVVDGLHIERNPSRTPLFDVFVALEDSSWSNYRQGLLKMQPMELPHNRSKFDLSFYFKETKDDGFAVHIEYCTALFKDETITLISERFKALLDTLLQKKEIPLSALEIMPESELARINAFNDTTELFNTERDIDSCFLSQLRKSSEAVAILESTGHSITYEEFNAKVTNLAVWLQAEGIASGEYAGVSFDRSLDMMIAIFAVMRIGATYVPLSAALPQSRLQSILEDLGKCTIICDAKFAEKFAPLDQLVLTPDIQNLPSQEFNPASIRPDSVAYTLFTSGSTGRPKGVPIEHRSLLNRILWMQSRFPIGEGDVVLQKTTVSFDVSIWELFWWSWTKASLALLEPEAEKDPRKIVDAIYSHKVTVLHFVPSMLRIFLEHLESCPEEAHKLESLKYVFASGEVLASDLVVRFNALLNAELHNLYGPTEAAIDVSWYPCRESSENVVPIGRPVSNTRLYVLDEHKQMVPLGVTGEIHISGVQVSKGYVNRPELTAESFLADPFNPGNRMYRTGDLGRWRADGDIEYLGRNDDQVKVRGFRIELGEVESALGRCNGVSQAVVRVCNIGELDSLEAFLLPSENGILSFSEIRGELATILPDYMCPAVFHEVDEIPLSPSGKVDRKQLKGRKLLSTGGIEEGDITALQEEIRDIWLEVMPEIDTPDIDQGFFEVGGNSLLLVKLHKLLDFRWEDIFTLASLFSESTIRKQSEYIKQIKPDDVVGYQETGSNGPIAIIGMAVRLGDYEDTESFWDDLAQGIDKNVLLSEKRQNEVRQIFEAVGFEFDVSMLREASYLSDISSFDFRRFGMSPNDARLLDPNQRLFLEVALQALDDAGYGGAALENKNVGTFVGASPCRLFQDAVTRAFPDQGEQIYLLNVPSNIVSRISYLKNWNGPAATIDTACSSVLKAIHDGCHSLRTGESCIALVGGVHTIDFPVKNEKAFAIEASSGQTRTFDAEADGVGAGEGAAVFVLKPLEQAQKDNDPIHAIIAGSAINQDGRSSSMAAPNPSGQADVISLAARNGSISLTDIDFFEAHGTATVLGDPVEVEALSKAFAVAGGEQKKKALIGSVKGNIGHLDAAAGALGLAKAVVSLEKGMMPPQPHFESPNPHIDFDASPVTVARSLEALPHADKPWICGVSSFGLSGINAHVIVKEHTQSAMPLDDGSWYCVPFSANDEPGLKEYCHLIGDAVSRNEDWPLHAIAGTLISGREYLGVRAVIIACSRQDLLDQLSETLSPVTIGRTVNSGVIGASLKTEADAVQAADKFLRGQKLLWPDERPLHRVHLPATLFDRSPLWPKFKSGFVSKPIKTPTGTAHSIAIGRADFWPVSEHVLNDVPTLVGMGVIDLICQAVGESTLIIENLRWHKPVSFVKGSMATLFLEKEDGGFSAELHQFQMDEWNLATSAKVRIEESSPLARIDIEDIRNSMHAFEAEGEQAFINVSKRWHCHENLWVSEGGNRLLSLLSLPDEFKQDLNTFEWHPAMLDLAASLALHNESGFVPARCGQIRLYNPLPADIFAHVVITDKKSNIITANCTITDQSGRVLLEMTDLVFISLQKAKSEPELYEVKWGKRDLPKCESGKNEKILLLGSKDSALYSELAGISCLHRELSEQVDDRKDLAREIVSTEIIHIIYLPSPESSNWSFSSQMQEICRARIKKPLHITVVGRGAFSNHETTPDDALILGMLLSLKQEEPLLLNSYVELKSLNAASIQTLKESLGLIDGPYLIKDDGSVCLQELVKISTFSENKMSTDGCIIITGGLGGMALTLAEQIRSETNAQIVLLHRNYAVHKAIPFVSYNCDINESARVQLVLDAIRRDIGPIKGVIHTAGIAGDGYLITKKQETFEKVLAPKVTGTWNLHEATLKDDLNFFVLASSRTSLVGAPGQTDYTAANAYLNGFAFYRRSKGLPALSICWNTWSGVGMAAGFQADEGRFSLVPKQAFGVLEKALSSDAAQVVVAMSDENVSRYKLAVIAEPEVEVEAGQTISSTDSIDSTEAEILEIIRECLGYESELSGKDDFYDFGGDSISGTRIVSRISETLGIDASVMDLLESDTLGDFIKRVLAEAKTEKPDKQRIEPAPEREKYPVGREQLSILYAELLSGEHTGFNLPAFLKLPQDLDKKRLEDAIIALIKRHEVLRTSFCDFDQEHPNMVIHPFGGFTLEEVHISDLSAKDSLITPFDVKEGALFRAKLLIVEESEFILFFDIHHALADGRTISLLNADLYKLYHQQPVEPVGLQQKDFAWYQFNHVSKEDKEYWLSLFDGDLPKMDLPSDYERPKVHTNRGGVHEFELSPKLVSGIKDLARKEGVTNYNIVLSAWSILVHKYTGDEDFVIAITVDSRNEHLNTAGMLASLIPLKLSVNSEKSLRSVLKDNQKVSLEALRHKSYILNNLLTDLQPPICLDRTLLSEIIISYMNFEFGTENNELFETLRFRNPASKADISVFGSDAGGRISFALEYYADLFSPDDMAKISEDFMHILELMTLGDTDEALEFEYSPRQKKNRGTSEKNLKDELSRKIRMFAEKKNTTLSAVMLTTFAALLSRVLLKKDFVIDIEASAPVQFLIDEDTEFEDLLYMTNTSVLNARGKKSAAPDSLGGEGEGEIMTIAFCCEAQAVPLSTVSFERNYDLVCFAQDIPGGMVLRFDYDRQFLTAETAENWLGYFELFLDDVVKVRVS